MRFDNLLVQLSSFPYFDMPTVRRLSGQAPNQVRTQVHRWLKTGKILALRRQMYTLADPYRKVPIQTACLANDLYLPSYLSGLWALGYFGMIPEKVVVYTSLTPRAPRRFKNAFGTFQYFHIKQDYFFGFSATQMNQQNVRLAEPEKALLDLWYLQPGEWSLDRMRSMRFQQFELVHKEKLGRYAGKFNSPRLLRAVRNWQALAAEEIGEGERT
jgi:predicted transcriptional regulator of viral defense system